MIQLNLLPDIKLQYIRTQRIKRLITVLAILLSGVSLIIFVGLLIYIRIYQNIQLTNMNQDISIASSRLNSSTNLNKILTIQNQLESLPALDAQKPVASRLFSYLKKLTPSNATISSVNLDFGQDTITISGSANSIKTINQYVDTIKFTNFSTSNATNQSTNPAFSNVLLSNFQVQNGSASYTITFTFNPMIFNVAYNTNLVVPKITTTRSILDQPNDLFNKTVTTSNSPTTSANTAIQSPSGGAL